VNAGTTIRVSLASDGGETLGGSIPFGPAISHDGLTVAFPTSADEMVPGETNGAEDVFVRDLVAGTTEIISSPETGTRPIAGPSANDARLASLSADGRFVVWHSSDALIDEDTNGFTDVFLHDRTTGKTMLVSRTSTGDLAASQSSTGWISGDGSAIVFSSGSALIPGMTGANVYVAEVPGLLAAAP